MSESPRKVLVPILIGICIVGLVYVLLMAYKKNNEPKDETHLKNYKVNEYIPSYVSDESMARIYLNDFVTTMYYDIEKAYTLLDSDYRVKKFGSLDNFKRYVSNLNFTSYTVKKYYKKSSSDGYTIYGVYDGNENVFIFKTDGVLQYSVFLDDYTVEIW